MSQEPHVEPESEVNEIADSLQKGQRVLFGDRSVPLEVVRQKKREITEVHRRRHGERSYHDVVILEGNGTTYHLLWQHGSGHNPILRTSSQWTETETEDGDIEYDYHHGGDRITAIEIVDETQTAFHGKS